MNGGTFAAILVGFFGLISGIGAAWLSYRAQRKTAQADEVAAAFSAYDDLLRNHREEIDRLRSDVTAARAEARDEEARLRTLVEAARAEAAHAEDRCRTCHAERAELLADLSALRAIVVDEVARTAAGHVIEEHTAPGLPVDDLTPEEREELDAIRHFLGRLGPPREGEGELPE